MMLMNIEWPDVFWGFFWFFVIIGLYSSLLIGYSRGSARKAYRDKELPELYDGKLKATLAENKLLKEENKLLVYDNKILVEKRIEVKKVVNGD
jgi:hypothetical protein